MVLGQHRRMWLEAMRQTEQRVYGFGSLKDGYALVGIHLRKQKCCLKKGTTSPLPCTFFGKAVQTAGYKSLKYLLQTCGGIPAGRRDYEED